MKEELAFIFKPDGFILDHIERKTELLLINSCDCQMNPLLLSQ